MAQAFRVFISCVSDEFRSYRTALRGALTSPEREIKIQEDFADGAGTLLEKLDTYISRCQAVVHLVGDGCGSKPQPAEVRWLLERYPSLSSVLPELATVLPPNACAVSYTQWECFLALYHRVPCYIYLADAGSAREPGWQRPAADAVEQQAHIALLTALGQDRRKEVFSDARDIALKFLNSYTGDGGQAAAQPTVGRSFQWPHLAKPAAYPLADREDEFAAFAALVTGQSHERILAFHGPSDRGKSVLLAQFYALAQALPGLHSAYSVFKTSLPLSHILWDTKSSLRALRFPRFERQLDRDAPEMLRAAFLQDLAEAREPVLLILDAYEQATEEARAWVEDRLLPVCRNHDGLRLVIAGHSSPRLDPSRPWAGFVKCRELPPIRNATAWWDFSQRVVGLTSVPQDHVATLVAAAQGSPRALSSLLKNLKPGPCPP